MKLPSPANTTSCDTPLPPDCATIFSVVGATDPEVFPPAPLPAVRFTATCWLTDPTWIVMLPVKVPDPLTLVLAVTVK